MDYISTAVSLTTMPVEAYPTSIPWLQDQATCEKTDRSRLDEQCWDSRHDPNF